MARLVPGSAAPTDRSFLDLSRGHAFTVSDAAAAALLLQPPLRLVSEDRRRCGPQTTGYRRDTGTRGPTAKHSLTLTHSLQGVVAEDVQAQAPFGKSGTHRPPGID